MPPEPSQKQKTGRARTSEAGSVRTLERGLTVLSALAELRSASLTQVAKQAGLSASTTYRLLETLRQQGFVEWEERSGTFTVGLQAYRVGAAFSERNNLLSVAQPEMQELVDALNETVNLAVLRDGEAVYVSQVQGKGLVRMFTQLGAVAPLHCSGVGKVLLAWRSAAEVVKMVGDGPFPAFTPHSITTLPALWRNWAACASKGTPWTTRNAKLVCVAWPCPCGTPRGKWWAA